MCTHYNRLDEASLMITHNIPSYLIENQKDISTLPPDMAI